MSNAYRQGGLIVGSVGRGNATIIEAEVPLSEMFGYTTDLRSICTGRAGSMIEPLRYAQVPANVRKRIPKENA
jgi:elongation factor G